MRRAATDRHGQTRTDTPRARLSECPIRRPPRGIPSGSHPCPPTSPAPLRRALRLPLQPLRRALPLLRPRRRRRHGPATLAPVLSAAIALPVPCCRGRRAVAARAVDSTSAAVCAVAIRAASTLVVPPPERYPRNKQSVTDHAGQINGNDFIKLQHPILIRASSSESLALIARVSSVRAPPLGVRLAPGLPRLRVPRLEAAPDILRP